MIRSLALFAITVSGVAHAGDPPPAAPEPLPTEAPVLTREACERQVPGWQAEFRRIEAEMQKAETAFETDPSEPNEASVIAAVEVFVNAMVILAPIEHQCAELVESELVESDPQASAGRHPHDGDSTPHHEPAP